MPKPKETFTKAELALLDRATRILAGKRIAIARKLQTMHPECYHAAVLSKARNQVDKALQNLPNWKDVDTMLRNVEL